MTKKTTGGLVIAAAMENNTSAEVQQLQLSEWIGQRKFSAALQKLLTVSDLVELQKIKETKSYKGFKAIGADGNPLTVSSFSDLCGAIGCSEQHINEQLLNLRTFGPEFLEFADQSLGYRDMRALRKLPEDQHAALRELASAKNTDALVEFVEKTIESHLSEKTALQKEIGERNDAVVAARERADTYRNERDSLQRQVNTLTRTQKPGDGEFDARTFEVRQEAAALEYGARICMDDLETLFEQVLNEDAAPQMQELRMRSIGLAVGGALARAQALFEAVRLGMDGDMPVQPNGDLLLSAAEKQRLDAGLTIIRENHKRAKGERADEAVRQAAAHQKGPGRRIGSKNTNGGDQ